MRKQTASCSNSSGNFSPMSIASMSMSYHTPSVGPPNMNAGVGSSTSPNTYVFPQPLQETTYLNSPQFPSDHLHSSLHNHQNPRMNSIPNTISLDSVSENEQKPDIDGDSSTFYLNLTTGSRINMAVESEHKPDINSVASCPYISLNTSSYINSQSLLSAQMVNMSCNSLGSNLGNVSPNKILNNSNNVCSINSGRMLVPHQLPPMTSSTPTSLTLMSASDFQPNGTTELISLNNSNSGTSWATFGGTLSSNHHHQMHIPRSRSPSQGLITTTLNPLSPSGYHPHSSSGFISAPQPPSYPQPFYTTSTWYGGL